MMFLSVRLLIDLAFVWSNLATVLLLIGFVFLLNSVINVGALGAVGAPWRVAFLAGFALAQVGEFAFVLAATGVASGLIGEEARRVVVAVIALTMVISPLWLGLARRLHALQAARPAPLAAARRAHDRRGCSGCARRAWCERCLARRGPRRPHRAGDRKRHRGPRQRAAAAGGQARRRSPTRRPAAARDDARHHVPGDDPGGRARGRA